MSGVIRRHASLKSCFLLSVVVIAVTAALWFGMRAAWADGATLEARWIVTAWRSGKGPARTPELWVSVREQVMAAARITPDNAQLHDDLGYLHSSQAMALAPYIADSFVLEYRQSLLEQALGNYRTSTALRPTFPYSWVYLALVKHEQGIQDAEFWHAFDNATRLGHAEAGVQPTLARIAFGQWATLAPERKLHIVNMIQSAQPAAGKVLLDIATANSVKL